MNYSTCIRIYVYSLDISSMIGPIPISPGSTHYNYLAFPEILCVGVIVKEKNKSKHFSSSHVNEINSWDQAAHRPTGVNGVGAQGLTLGGRWTRVATHLCNIGPCAVE